jgi:hypothetical protein
MIHETQGYVSAYRAVIAVVLCPNLCVDMIWVGP